MRLTNKHMNMSRKSSVTLSVLKWLLLINFAWLTFIASQPFGSPNLLRVSLLMLFAMTVSLVSRTSWLVPCVVMGVAVAIFAVASRNHKGQIYDQYLALVCGAVSGAALGLYLDNKEVGTNPTTPPKNE